MPIILILRLVHFAQGQHPEIRFYGLKILVDDMQTSRHFYQDVLGFEVLDEDSPKTDLKTGTWPIQLQISPANQASTYPQTARTGLTIETYKLLPEIDRLRKLGVLVYDTLLARNGVGISIPFQDPSANVLSMMEVQVREVPNFEGLRIYNCGVTGGDMESLIKFYRDILGFEEWSPDYLPWALPLKHADGTFAFMLHYKPGLERNKTDYGISPQMIIILSTPDLEKMKSYLTSVQIEFSSVDNFILCQDPAGNFLEIVGWAK